MREDQFIGLPSQGTIYSVSRLGNHVILGTGNQGTILAHMSKNSIEEVPLNLPNAIDPLITASYKQQRKQRNSALAPNLFAKVSNCNYDIDIVSVDAYVGIYPVLAVAFVQSTTPTVHEGVDDGKGSPSFLHIYSTWRSADQESPSAQPKAKSRFRPKEEFDASQFEILGEHCKTFRLGYIPYHLYHVPVLKSNGQYGNVFLLSGSDKLIHTYESDDENLTFLEVPTKTYFPELAEVFKSVVTRIQIEAVNIARRVSICGFENGSLRIWISKSNSVNESTSSRKCSDPTHDQAEDFDDENKLKDDDDSDSDVPVSMLIRDNFEVITHSFDGMINSIQSYTDGFQLNIIVASALSPTYVYTNALEERFKVGTPLKFSSRWDCVEACCVADIDLDGRAEIILGTFGCTMLVYKFMDDLLAQWVIVAHKKFSSPILAIHCVNYYLHVVTTGGFHVIEYSTSAYFLKHGIVVSPGSNAEDVREEGSGSVSPTESEERIHMKQTPKP